jgi:hypothetical protein
MHKLCRTDDRIDGTSLDAKCASNAAHLIDYGDSGRSGSTISGIQWLDLDAEQVGKRRRRLVAARRALIDIRGAGSDRIGVCATVWIPACTALRLR